MKKEVHPLLSWPESKENLHLTVDESWKYLQADASNNLLPPALKDLQAGRGSRVRKRLGLSRKRREAVFGLASCTFY